MFIARKSEEEQAAFFEAVHEKALQAQAAAGIVSHVIQVAGTHVRLIFAGDRLEKEIMPALAHLKTDADNADVSFHVWESRSTGVTMVEPPCARDHFTDRGDIWGFGSERYRIAFHWSEFSVCTFDRHDKIGVWWVENADLMPFWTKASPLRSLFQWWMEMNGKQLVHAAAIGTEAGAVLVTGRGGVGKSTTALSGIVEGLRYTGDDYLIVGLEPEPTVYSLYGTAKLNPDQMVKFPRLAPFLTNERFLGEQKAVLQLFPHFAGQIAPSMKLRALLTPRFGSGDETSFAHASPLQLHRATSFTTMSQLPYAGRFTHEFVHRMVEEVPGLEMVLGRDLKGVIHAIKGLLGHSDAQLQAMAKADTAPDSGLPMVSVVLPVFNGARFLKEAVSVVLRQNYPALEIIVIDDGSTDDIDAVVALLPVEVRYFKQDNAGAAAARNRGIKDASGEMIAFLDVDDLWPENNLPALVDTLRANPDADLVHGHGQLMEYDGRTGQFEYVGSPKESFPFYIGAGLYRRAAFERIGLFDTTLKFGEDTDWYNRAREAGFAILRVPEVTLFVRRHDSNLTNGRTIQELMALRTVKKQLDRRREASDAPQA
ncbi:MAG TPA: glycosyltransferase [Rhizomicrobium sp.]|jgi:GT2 family glycosyltransferase|nr:glycosyltransferase [Rhizomicrobium sp.]